MQKRKISFNIIDALIIILVVAVGSAAYFLFFGRDDVPTETNNLPDMSKVKYVLQVNELPTEYSDNISVGENVIDYETYGSAGVVTSVEYENYVYVGHNKTTGEQKLTSVDDYINLYITVEGDAVMKSEMYYVNNTDLYIGKRLDMMMPDLFCSGYIVSLEVVE